MALVRTGSQHVCGLVPANAPPDGFRHWRSLQAGNSRTAYAALFPSRATLEATKFCGGATSRTEHMPLVPGIVGQWPDFHNYHRRPYTPRRKL
jgi:hypothetical protein